MASGLNRSSETWRVDDAADLDARADLGESDRAWDVRAIDGGLGRALTGSFARETGRIFEVARSVCQVARPGTWATGALIDGAEVITAKHLFVHRGVQLSDEVFATFRARFFVRDAEGGLTAVIAGTPIAGSLRFEPDGHDVALFRVRFSEGVVAPPPLVRSARAAESYARVATVHWPVHRDEQSVSGAWGSAVSLGDGRVSHSLDTAPGSSGAPIFDEAWEVVAVHSGGDAHDPRHKLGSDRIRF
jgi:Trypsin-like peptidase domain